MKRKIREAESVSYWKSMVDAITTLMMVILLIMMFFVLCFLNVRDKMYDDDGNTYSRYDHSYDDIDDAITPTPTPTPNPHTDYGGDGGGAGSVDPIPTPTPQPIIEEWDVEGYDRAAVYVQLVDEETGLRIDVPDVVFELYSAAGSRQTLSTYYPELISYNEFLTTNDGDFYLPEKIRVGTYFLRQMTEVERYDFSADTYFEIDEAYDWNDPLIVEVPLGAAQNNIQIQLDDGVTDVGIPDVIFDVVANGVVITPDGTVRYSNGEIVDTIECDSTGYGLSHELYLGDYRLIPRNLPFGYAAPELSTREITLPRRSAAGEYAPIVELVSYKTSVNVTVTDELTPGLFVEGATYVLSADGEESRVYTTNAAGHITIEDLSKNTSYRLMQTGTAPGYILTESVFDFTVDSLGYISTSPNYIIETTNRIIRVSIATLDMITRTPLTDVNITLTNSNGVIVETWVAESSSHSIEGLEPGMYYVSLEGKDDKITITVEDVCDLQKFSTSFMSTTSILIVVGIIIVLIAILAFFVYRLVLWHIKTKKEKEQKLLDDQYKKVNEKGEVQDVGKQENE